MQRSCSTRGYVGALCRFVVVAVALIAGSTVAFAQQGSNSGDGGPQLEIIRSTLASVVVLRGQEVH
jgi:hypothetical protein